MHNAFKNEDANSVFPHQTISNGEIPSSLLKIEASAQTMLTHISHNRLKLDGLCRCRVKACIKLISKLQHLTSRMEGMRARAALIAPTIALEWPQWSVRMSQRHGTKTHVRLIQIDMSHPGAETLFSTGKAQFQLNSPKCCKNPNKFKK